MFSFTLLLYYFVVVLGVCTLGYLKKLLQCFKYIILEFTPSAALLLFALVIFEIGSCFMLGPTWAVILLFVLPYVSEMTGVSHSALPLRWVLTNFLPGLDLNHDPPNLCLPSS
jgi:hypothetical protein